MKPQFVWALRPTARSATGGLGVSDIYFLVHRKQIEKRNIIATLSLLTYENNQLFYDKIDGNLDGLVSARKRLFFKDNQATDIKQYFDSGFQFIQKHIQRGNVLVHCVHGRSRSPSMAVAYMMYTRKIPYSDAIGILKSQYDSISPNSGFIKQLKEYQLQLGLN